MVCLFACLVASLSICLVVGSLDCLAGCLVVWLWFHVDGMCVIVWLSNL